MATPNVSVVIVTYQTGSSLRVAVDSVLKQEGLTELLLVDNGNPEPLLNWMREIAQKDSRVKLITGHGNVGYARACNLGAAQASGDYILILNPDAILPEASFTTLAAEMDAHPDAWVLSAHLLNADGSEQRGGRRKRLTPSNAVAESLWLYRFTGMQRVNDHNEPPPATTSPVEAISGAFMFFRASAWRQLGGMDETYFLHVEDLDICRRVHEQGGVIYYVPSLQVVHLKSTSKVTNAFLEWQKFLGFVIYFRKFYGPAIWLPMVPALLLRFALRVALGAILRLLPERENHKAVRRVLLLHDYRLNADPENQPYEGKTVLITGATSQIGICALGRLLAGGAKVIALQHTSRVHYTHPNLTWIDGDLLSGQLNLRGQQPETLIHCASLWLLPPALSAIFAAKTRRLIAFGSISVFTKIYSANEKEKDTVEKLENAELQLAERSRKIGANYTILRPTMVYGVGLDENVTQVSEFAKRYHFFPVYPPAKGRRQPVHADDLAQLALKIIDNAKTFNKSYNIGGGEILSYQAMVERVFFALGQRPRIVKFKEMPQVMDIASKFLGSRFNGEMARRMNEDLLFIENDSRRDFLFKPRAFLKDGARDLGQF